MRYGLYSKAKLYIGVASIAILVVNIFMFLKSKNIPLNNQYFWTFEEWRSNLSLIFIIFFAIWIYLWIYGIIFFRTKFRNRDVIKIIFLSILVQGVFVSNIMLISYRG
ncbi:MAG: hypothetical protein ACRC41_01455 [Sarcina sp.]